MTSPLFAAKSTVLCAVARVFSPQTSPLDSEHGFDPVSLARLQQVDRKFACLFGQDRFWRPFLPEPVEPGVLAPLSPSTAPAPNAASRGEDASFAQRAFQNAFGCLGADAKREVVRLYDGPVASGRAGSVVTWLDAHRAAASHPTAWLVVQAAVMRAGDSLRQASDSLRAAPRLAWLAVQSSPPAYAYVLGAPRLEFALAAAAVGRAPHLIAALPPVLAANVALLQLALRQSPSELASCPWPMRKQAAVVRTAVAVCGTALRHASPSVRDEASVVRLAVAQDGEALAFASERLRADLETVLVAVRQDGRALRHASPALRDHDAVADAAVASRPEACAFVGARQRTRRELARSAAMHPDVRLHMLEPRWLVDAAIVALTLPRCRGDLWLLEADVAADERVRAASEESAGA